MKKKIIYLMIICAIVLPQLLRAQNVGIGTTTPAGSAALDVSSTSKGILIPRMTTAQRIAIAAPANGLMVYDTDHKAFWLSRNGVWGVVLTLPGGAEIDAPGPVLDITNTSDAGQAITGSTEGHGTGIAGFSSDGIGGHFQSLNGDSAAVYGLADAGPGGEFKSATGPAVRARGNVDIVKSRLRFSGDPSASMVQGIEFTNSSGTALNGLVGKYNDSMMGFYGYTGGGWKTLFNNTNGNVGLQGNTNPRAPLSFASSLGNKIALWGNADVAHYGIGISGGALQLYTDGVNSDVVLGYGNSMSFSENMRIKGNGNVGIGTNMPTDKLHVNGTAKITGNATINGALQVQDDAIFAGNVSILGSNPSAGKVLTSVNNNGSAEWRMPAISNSGISAALSTTTLTIPFVPTDTAGGDLVQVMDITVPFSTLGGFDDAGVFTNSTHAVTVGPGVYFLDAAVKFTLSSINNGSNQGYGYSFTLQLIETAPNGITNVVLTDYSESKIIASNIGGEFGDDFQQPYFKLSGIQKVASQGLAGGRFYWRIHMYARSHSNNGYFPIFPAPVLTWDNTASHLSFFKLY